MLPYQDLSGNRADRIKATITCLPLMKETQ
jgi:hypothetical protein